MSQPCTVMEERVTTMAAVRADTNMAQPAVPVAVTSTAGATRRLIPAAPSQAATPVVLTRAVTQATRAVTREALSPPVEI
ncbi:hypothetical protein [Candidatus Dormiibacter inghamiae]|uniref:hypothetical protein n=1 Tax=Candidatus Dormiibacter inghamiae TaxID=3127013 RepID=UPI0030C7549A